MQPKSNRLSLRAAWAVISVFLGSKFRSVSRFFSSLRLENQHFLTLMLWPVVGQEVEVLGQLFPRGDRLSFPCTLQGQQDCRGGWSPASPPSCPSRLCRWPLGAVSHLKDLIFRNAGHLQVSGGSGSEVWGLRQRSTPTVRGQGLVVGCCVKPWVLFRPSLKGGVLWGGGPKANPENAPRSSASALRGSGTRHRRLRPTRGSAGGEGPQRCQTPRPRLGLPPARCRERPVGLRPRRFHRRLPGGLTETLPVAAGAPRHAGRGISYGARCGSEQPAAIGAAAEYLI